LGSNPELFRSWVLNELGEKLYDDLTLRANKPMKIPKCDEKPAQKHFKEQLEEIKQKRSDGHCGYIDFVEYF